MDAAVNKNNNASTSNNADWDLYPGSIRNIENDGTLEQVDKLHRMQNNNL